MKRVLQAAAGGILFGFGLGFGFEEFWVLSIAFYSASCLSLWLFIRASLRRYC
jgi:hypothetical protein